jgi:hypothetical protein
LDFHFSGEEENEAKDAGPAPEAPRVTSGGEPVDQYNTNFLKGHELGRMLNPNS